MPVFINGIAQIGDMLKATYDPDDDGRIEKEAMEWAVNKLLEGAGVGADPTEIDVPGAATKEFFVPATVGISGGVMDTYQGYYPGVQLNASGERGYVSFNIPADFSSIISATLRCIPLSAQANANWDIAAAYCASGEAFDAHTESDTVSTYNVIVGQRIDVDVSGILTSIVAGDLVGMRLQEATSAHNVYVVGLYFKYN